MIDPITAFSAATAAYSGIKKAISVGQDITSMGSTLSQWSKAVSDLDFLDQKAQKPPIYKMFSNTESDALEIWTKKQKVKEMREELRSFISWNYGPSAWEEIVRIEAQQRKAQREAVYAKEEFRQKIIDITLAVLIIAVALGIMVAVIYYLGKGEGKW
jgi:hypothetical protein